MCKNLHQIKGDNIEIVTINCQGLPTLSKRLGHHRVFLISIEKNVIQYYVYRYLFYYRK